MTHVESKSAVRRNPTLRLRLIVQLLLLILGSAAIAVTAIGGIVRIHSDGGFAIQGYRQLRAACEIGFHVALAQNAMRPPVTPEMAQREIDAALLALSTDRAKWLDPTESLASALESDLQAAREATTLQATNAALSRSTSQIAAILAKVRVLVTDRQASADRQRKFAIAAVSVAATFVVLAGAFLALRQYHGVMRPITRLADGLREFSAGDLSRRVGEHGDREFAELSRDFNAMAERLQVLCDDLSRQVAAQSRELVKSERLASVGYLAAGVAHEINNPLGIISGFGEQSLKRLRRGFSRESVPQLERSLSIICEEAFRCKGITDRLLNLQHPSGGGSQRTRVSLGALAHDVVDVVAGLSMQSDANIQLLHSSNDELAVLANEDEIKQVLLNLLMNAIAAVGADGKILVELSRLDAGVQMSVVDNGIGMEEQMIDRVFEPFFTGQARRGTGLGLSITHAIVMSHGGTVRAESSGRGKGSRFTVILPAGPVRAEVGDAVIA